MGQGKNRVLPEKLPRNRPPHRLGPEGMAVPSISIQTSTGDRLNADTENLAWTAAAVTCARPGALPGNGALIFVSDFLRGRRPALLPWRRHRACGLLTRTSGHSYYRGIGLDPRFTYRLETFRGTHHSVSSTKIPDTGRFCGHNPMMLLSSPDLDRGSNRRVYNQKSDNRRKTALQCRLEKRRRNR
jgi:hypothetical protein